MYDFDHIEDERIFHWHLERVLQLPALTLNEECIILSQLIT